MVESFKPRLNGVLCYNGIIMQEVSKETAKELMKTRGEVIGLGPKSDFEYVRYKIGEEAIKKLEEEMKSLGCPLEYKKLRSLAFYPIGVQAVILLAMKKAFNFSREEFQRVGEFSARMPLIIKIFMRYLVSFDVLTKGAPKMWNRYYSVGELKVIELNKEKRYVVVRIENFRLTSLLCETFKGYFCAMLQMVIKGPVTCEETKCVHKGDEYHEFLLKW